MHFSFGVVNGAAATLRAGVCELSMPADCAFTGITRLAATAIAAAEVSRCSAQRLASRMRRGECARVGAATLGLAGSEFGLFIKNPVLDALVGLGAQVQAREGD